MARRDDRQHNAFKKQSIKSQIFVLCLFFIDLIHVIRGPGYTIAGDGDQTGPSALHTTSVFERNFQRKKNTVSTSTQSTPAEDAISKRLAKILKANDRVENVRRGQRTQRVF